MKYTVVFEQRYLYEAEADSEDEAFDIAYKEFESEMRYSVASAWYDSVDIECNEDEDEDRSCETCYGSMDDDEVGNPCWNCRGNHSEWYPKMT